MPGRGVGSVLPEAVKAAGADGVLLNHVERRLSVDDWPVPMRRAGEVGLATMVCADDVEDAVAIAELSPDVIIVEAPDLIAGGRRGEGSRAAVAAANAAVRRVDPASASSTARASTVHEDVYDVAAAGAQGQAPAARSSRRLTPRRCSRR